MENGLDAHGITEHGNANSFAHAMLWVEQWNKEHKDKPFKYLPGVEFYFHPDLKQWERDAATAEQAKANKAAAKKLAKEQEKLQTKIMATVDGSDETEELDTTNALVVENEDESKSTKHFNPVNRRHHLVVLPKNSRGLQKLFSLVSRSYLKGFYRFPRIDLEMLREVGADSDLVASSACIAGLAAFNVFQELQKLKFEELNQTLLDDRALLDRCANAVGNCYDMMASTFGEGNYFLELQFNKLPAQNLVNRAILEFAKRSNVTKQLSVTADSHYPRPELWKERELYKKLGWMNYTEINADSLPKSKDDLKCELYPKNAQQLWDTYLTSKDGTAFYDDDTIAGAIERTHDIAHLVIGEVPPDRSPKFPNKLLIPEGTPSFNHLVKLCKEGMQKRGLQDKPEYIARVKEELGVIKAMKNSDYFISYQKIMELARKVCLCGPGRGCFVPETRVLVADGTHVPIGMIKVGDAVKDANGDDQVVTQVFRYQVDEELLELEFDDGKRVSCTKDHRFLTRDRGWVEAQHLTVDDELVEVHVVRAIILNAVSVMPALTIGRPDTCCASPPIS